MGNVYRLLIAVAVAGKENSVAPTNIDFKNLMFVIYFHTMRKKPSVTSTVLSD